MTDAMDTDRRIDELFALPPEQFTAARNNLVRELRGADQREQATALSRLRRPTVAAWAVNQTVRTHREQFDALLEAGDQVRRAQRRALSGVSPGDLRDATRARRAHIEQLAQLATDFLTERGVAADSHHSDIVATFDAASADPDSAAAVGAARLSQALPVSPGFGALTGLTVFATPPEDSDDGPSTDTTATQAADDRGGDRDDDDRREQAALARRAAMRAVEDVRRRFTEAQAAVTRAAAEVTRAEARAAAADQTAQVAQERARRLLDEAEDLRARADRARDRSADAQREAHELETQLRLREQELQALDD